jgi:hypothetical protein
MWLVALEVSSQLQLLPPMRVLVSLVHSMKIARLGRTAEIAIVLMLALELPQELPQITCEPDLLLSFVM